MSPPTSLSPPSDATTGSVHRAFTPTSFLLAPSPLPHARRARYLPPPPRFLLEPSRRARRPLPLPPRGSGVGAARWCGMALARLLVLDLRVRLGRSSSFWPNWAALLGSVRWGFMLGEGWWFGSGVQGSRGSVACGTLLWCWNFERILREFTSDS